MSDHELVDALVKQRHEFLRELLEATTQQELAIENGHMNELMQILATKQRLVESFAKASEQLRSVRQRLPNTNSVSDSTRQLNLRCNEMHEELLRREEDCQERLTRSRDEIAQEIAKGDGARRAVSGYNQAMRSGQERQGGGLDLSSDA